MAKAKSNRRNLALRQQRARQKKQAKRATRRRSSRQQIDYIARPAMSDMEAPEGFRAIPMSQAMIHYAQPILEKTQSEEELHDAMNAAMIFWNYSLLREKEGKSAAVAEVENGILDTLKASLKIDAAAARDFTEMMFQRHCYLFPEDIQPRGTPFAFIRKEKRYRIEPIAEDRIRLNTEPIGPSGREEKIVQDLRQLEELIEQEADYEKREQLLAAVTEALVEDFREWLSAKRIEEALADNLSGCLPIWMDFIYAYGHDEDTSLRRVPAGSWRDFFDDFLLRKLMVDPAAYAQWPAALKLFYRYLQERGYLESAHEAEDAIRRIEPGFYRSLAKVFS